MADPVQPLTVNTLQNVCVVEELIQLSFASDAEIIGNWYWTDDLT